MNLKRQTKSILSEIFEYTEEVNDLKNIEARAEHAFTSFFNFMSLIDKLNISKEDKDDLYKRAFISIKNRDTSRFIKAIKRIQREGNGT